MVLLEGRPFDGAGVQLITHVWRAPRSFSVKNSLCTFRKGIYAIYPLGDEQPTIRQLLVE